jgi:hypothetical protein
VHYIFHFRILIPKVDYSELFDWLEFSGELDLDQQNDRGCIILGIGNFDYMHFFIGENLYFGPFKNNNNIEEILH